MERTVFMDRSGDACDHYHCYAHDLDQLAALGFNAYRFSLEWARVEPEEGHFSSAQLDHYRGMLAACNQRGLKTMLTLHQTGGLDEFFSRTDASNNTLSYQTDALGSTVALWNTTPTNVTNYTHQPFGATTVTGSAGTNAEEFTGRENDGTGLYFYRARYYNPTYQRFIVQDPIEFRSGYMNLTATLIRVVLIDISSRPLRRRVCK